MEDRDYQVVLGRPWLRAADPDLILLASTWRYCKQTPQIVIEQPRQFAKTMKTNLTMMVMYRPEAVGEAVAGLPRRYQRWWRVFSESEAAVLPREKTLHAIPIEPGKEPPWGPLYSLSQRELQTLWEYINKMLEWGWIRPSQSAAGAPVLFV
jgi:hypothetical protein